MASPCSSRPVPATAASIADAEFAAAGRHDRADGRRRVEPAARREGEGAPADASSRCSATTSRCSPTSTSPPTPRWPRRSSRPGTTGIAYETVQLPTGALPLLAPMSRGRRPARPAGRCPLPRSATRAAAACCSAAPPACGRRASWCSAPATSAGTRPGSPPAWRPR